MMLPPRRGGHTRLMIFLAQLVLALPVLALAACGSDEGPPQDPAFPAALGQEYVVGYGETVRIGTLSLEFTTLAEDSRCPLNATCVWEGNARILVTAHVGGNIGVLALNTAAPHFPDAGTFEGYSVVLKHLAPYPPWSEQPVQSYEATLVVDRAP